MRLPGSVDEPMVMIDYTINALGDEHWAHQNRLGSVVAVTDDTGDVVEQYTYSSYGESGGTDTGFPFRFTGQKLDPETGLYYYKARYYDPETGRFLQTDPIGYEDQMNLYAYAHNDPVNLIDPEGEQARPPRRRGGSGTDPRTGRRLTVAEQYRVEQYNVNIRIIETITGRSSIRRPAGSPLHKESYKVVISRGDRQNLTLHSLLLTEQTDLIKMV